MIEFKAFGKAQVSAFLGGMIDYGIMIMCSEILGMHYVIGIAIGGIVGALINFSINKYWSFSLHSKAGNITQQLGKFILVVTGSIVLKSAGTYALTEIFYLDYRISRIITDALVSFGFNYTLQRFWVFGK